MKMTVSYPKDLYEGSMELELENNIGDTISVRFGSGEPEDMSLARDLNDAMKLEDLVNMAYQAGLNREELEVINESDGESEE